MNDQARQLRQLMIKDALSRVEADGCVATRVHFCSGRRGTGTTMVAVNASMALARSGASVLLVTQHLEQADELAAIGHVIQPVPDSGFEGKLFVGPFGLALYQPDASGMPLKQLGKLADFVLIDVDAGTAGTKPSQRDVVVYVTTTDNASILETYSLMKSQAAGCGPCLLVANRVESDSAGWEVLKRFCLASDDFADAHLTAAAVIPFDDSGQASQGALVMQSPTSDLARRFEAIAERICKLGRASGCEGVREKT